MKDVMTENSNPNFKEAEELNKKLDDATSAISLLMKKLFGDHRDKTEDKNNVVPFKRRERKGFNNRFKALPCIGRR